MISSVTAAPPTMWRRSSTSTFFPARARYAALTSPLWPPPITTTSYFWLIPALPTNPLSSWRHPMSRFERTKSEDA